MIDRYSSTTLNRPFAIDDRDIEVGFPADASDEELVAATGTCANLDAFQPPKNAAFPNDVTIFFLCVKLRQISSQIHTEFSRLKDDVWASRQPHLVPGHIYIALNKLLQALDNWRDSAPLIESPRCLYECQEWYDLLQAREKLYLVRRAVDITPKREGVPSKAILTLLLKAALRTIQLYSALCQRKSFINYTRSYFHMMFTAGLSAMFCVSVSSALEYADILESAQCLALCYDTLKNMVEDLSDAHFYVTIFEGLHRNISGKISRALNSLPYADGTPVGQASNERPGNGHFTPTAPADVAPHLLSPQATRVDAATRTEVLNNLPCNQSPQLTVGQRQGGYSGVEFNGASETSAFTYGSGSPTDDLLQWAFLHDDMQWNMETVLGEYVYGDPSKSADIFSGF